MLLPFILNKSSSMLCELSQCAAVCVVWFFESVKFVEKLSG